MTTIVPGQRTALGRPLRRDDHDRRRAKQLRTGRWCPMAAMRPSRDSRGEVASNQYSAAGWAPGPAADRKEAGDEGDL
jgi:hypothetical protein